MAGYLQEALLSLFFSAVGGLFFWASTQIESFASGIIGPESFPKLLGIILIILGAANLVRVLSDKTNDNMKFRSNLTVLWGVLICGAYIYLIPKFGYFYVTPVFSVCLLLLLGYRNIFRVLCVTAGFTLVAYALFYKLLSVALPV